MYEDFYNSTENAQSTENYKDCRRSHKSILQGDYTKVGQNLTVGRAYYNKYFFIY